MDVQIKKGVSKEEKTDPIEALKKQQDLIQSALDDLILGGAL
jgi:hypothetical protein